MLRAYHFPQHQPNQHHPFFPYLYMLHRTRGEKKHRNVSQPNARIEHKETSACVNPLTRRDPEKREHSRVAVVPRELREMPKNTCKMYDAHGRKHGVVSSARSWAQWHARRGAATAERLFSIFHPLLSSR
jgi:hypothetical protein